MDTLNDLIAALILAAQAALILRFIICSIRETNQEDQRISEYKKQKKTCLVAFLFLLCVYDIPKLLEQYFM